MALTRRATKAQKRDVPFVVVHVDVTSAEYRRGYEKLDAMAKRYEEAARQLAESFGPRTSPVASTRERRKG